jgi:hypothetical protein
MSVATLHELHRPLGSTGLLVSRWAWARSSWAATRA